MVGNPAMSLHVEGETGTHYTEQWKEGGNGGGMLEDFLPCKTMFTVKAIARKAAIRAVKQQQQSLYLFLSLKSNDTYSKAICQ